MSSMLAAQPFLTREAEAELALLRMSHPPSLLDGLPIGIYACEADGSVRWFNKAAAVLWGREPTLGEQAERFCGSFKLYNLDGTHIPHAECPMADALRTGVGVRGGSVVIERPDGERILGKVHIQPVRDGNGAIVGAINCFQEASPNLAEVARQRAHEDFFENVAVPMHLVSGEGLLLQVNQAEQQLLGYAAHEMLGRPIAEFHADAETIEDILRRLRHGETLRRYPARLRAKDGSIRHVEITSNGLFRSGRLVHTRCVTVDVTAQHELRESEDRFRQLLDALPAAVYTTDAAGRITYFNEAAVTLAGRRPRLGVDEWCVTWRLRWPDGTPLPHDQCPMAVALKENRPVRGVEAMAERPDGTLVPFVPYPTPLRDGEGRLVGAVNMLVDVSERKNAEAHTRLLLKELNHRVKNNMQTITALLRRGHRHTASPEARAVLADASRQVSAMAAAQQVLYRMADSVSFDAAEFLTAVCATARPTLNAELTVECEPGLRLPNDSAMPLALIITELLTNAGKHARREGSRLILSVSFGRDGDAYLLAVEDNGRGFELQGNAAARTSGLSLVSGLARQLGGSFAVERGAGTRCLVRFVNHGIDAA